MLVGCRYPDERTLGRKISSGSIKMAQDKKVLTWIIHEFSIQAKKTEYVMPAKAGIHTSLKMLF